MDLTGITWTRKPSRWDEITAKIDLESLVKIIDKGQYIINWDELWINNNPSPIDRFVTRNVPQYFILFANRKVYYVNTEGYDYCRYIVEITR